MGKSVEVALLSGAAHAAQGDEAPPLLGLPARAHEIPSDISTIRSYILVEAFLANRPERVTFRALSFYE